MSNDTALLVVSVCGIVAVVIILAAFLLIRIFKMSLFGLANLVLKSVITPPEEPSRLDGQAHAERQHPRNLRAEAQAVDFDAAVAQKKGEAVPSVRTAPTVLPPARAQVAPVNEDSRPLRPRRRRMPDEDNEGLLDGFLDEDNDAGLFG
ncbi:MAG: hypothetical protein R3E39_28660 [Anaerolineae bacterium]